MNNYLTIRKIEQPHTKHIMEVCASDDKFDIQEVTTTFSKACTIVDAQFYYTNPLLFVFVKKEDCTEFAHLYADYFLIPPRYYDTIDIDTNCIAANAVFIDHICSLSGLSEEEPRVKHSQKELQEREDTAPHTLNSLFELYQEKGLYIIGIGQK